MGARLPDIKFKEVIEKANTGTIFLHVSRSLGGRRIGVAICKCGKNFTFRPNDNHTGYCPDCSRMVAGKNKSKGFDVFIQRAKDSHGDRFLYDESSYSGISGKVRIKCEKHGWFEQVANQHYKRNAEGCTKCGIDKAADGAVSRCKTANGLRECARCKEVLPLDMFKVYKRIKNEKEYLKHTAYCLQCKREKDKIRMATLFVTDEYREKQRLWALARIEKTILDNIGATSDWYAHIDDVCLNNKGASSFIYAHRCTVCGVAEVKRIKPLRNGYCTKHRHNGLTRVHDYRSSNCPVCGISHIAKKKNSLCNGCKIESLRKSRRDVKGRRRARKHNAMLDGPVNASKVFNRDKWRCYICGIKTQKKDIMADNAAELDHIVPLSKGGAHTYSNVRCSCRACNQSKSNLLIGQLVMSL